MILTHYSETPFEFKNPYEFTGVGHKPKGLWLSDDSDYGWAEWCKNQKFRLHALKYQTHFMVMVDNSKFLHLKSYSDIYEFTRKYRDLDAVFKASGFTYVSSTLTIDWERLKREFGGFDYKPLRPQSTPGFHVVLRLGLRERLYLGFNSFSTGVV